MQTNTSDRLKIVVPGDNPPQIQGSPHLKRLEPYGDVILHTDRPESFEEKINRAKDADILMNTRGLVTWPAEALRQLPKLRLISTCSIGTDNIDLEAARELGIIVSNQPGRTAPVVAEHSFGLMFAAAKRAAFMTAAVKAGQWPRMDNIFLGGKTLAIVGTGNRPWAQFTQPVPSVTGAASTRGWPSCSRQTQAPITSTMESIAPTSWKWTSSGGCPWIRPSATAMR